MNDFRLGVPGGGNLGFAVDTRTSVTLELGSKPSVAVSAPVDEQRSQECLGLVHHALTVWSSTVRARDTYFVRVESIAPHHVGLASSAAIQVAILSGLNWMNGHPLSDHQLRQLVAYKYREARAADLLPGFTTGLSSFLNLYGGFAIVASSLECTFHRSLPAWTYALVTTPRHSHVSHGEAEIRTLMEDGRRFDREQAGEKMTLVNKRLVPAVEDADLDRFGDAVRALQGLGSKRAEIALHGVQLYDVIDSVRSKGIECAFLSAVGPGIILLTSKTRADLEFTASRAGLSILCSGTVDSNGLRVETIGSAP